MAEIQVVDSRHRRTSFDRTLPPVVEVSPGATLRFETGDDVFVRMAGGEPVQSIGLENINTVTGPVAIRDAERGDLLRIEILAMEIFRAWAVWIPGFGPLGSRTPAVQIKQIPIEGTSLRLAETVAVPLAPMIGCMGLAPEIGRGSTLRPTFHSGGNMDLRELSPGAVIWLPVQVPGALLSIGDLHAAMGHGEPAHVSLEAAGAATVRVDVEKRRTLPYPRLRVGTDTIFVGMDDQPRLVPGGIASAYQRAIDQAFDYLTSECHLDPFTAYAYISGRVSTRFGGPAGSLVLAVVPDYIPRITAHQQGGSCPGLGRTVG